eukprot:scaffold568107_cov22-Prasinocladus_malaysianus.AAC.1
MVTQQQAATNCVTDMTAATVFLLIYCDYMHSSTRRYLTRHRVAAACCHRQGDHMIAFGLNCR